MVDEDIGAIVIDRLEAARLMPPVTGIEVLVDGIVLIIVSPETTPGQAASVEQVLGTIPYRIEAHPNDEGVLYD